MSRYAMRNPENPHGDPNGYFPQPHTEAEDGGRSYFVPDGAIDPNIIVSAPGKVISKYAGLTPDQVLEKMAADNAQNQRFVEHGPELVAELRRYVNALGHQYDYRARCKAQGDCAACSTLTFIARVEGK